MAAVGSGEEAMRVLRVQRFDAVVIDLFMPGLHGFDVIGEAADVSRFIYATGFSGHGFLLGPAVGEVLRDLVLGHTPPVDVSGFDVARFAGETRPEHNIV